MRPDTTPLRLRRVSEKTVAPLTCQQCKKLAPDGIQYQIGMNDLKPEDVSKLNLSGPKVASIRSFKTMSVWSTWKVIRRLLQG